MKTLFYEVEFLTDIVLPATSNTEGNIEQLDFIPGSTFLGIVARNYDSFQDSFDVFHGGKVRFGDATMLCKNKPTFKIPLSFFHEKGDESKFFNHHNIVNFDCYTQLKQKRRGYITKDLELVNPKYTYSQKSAYSKEERKSKDGDMYGYVSMQAGTKWSFCVKIDNGITENDTKLINSSLIGNKRIGKSKSAQYGLAEIKPSKINLELNTNISSDKFDYLYVNSRLALVDDSGSPTCDLENICKDLKKEDILHHLSQIKTTSYSPYNFKRETRDFERVCIAKGSVIVVKKLSQSQKEAISRGVGAFLSEGFGEVLINPDFLLIKGEIFLKESHENESKTFEEKAITSSLGLFLQSRENLKMQKLKLGNEVEKFINEHKKHYSQKMNSQWGAIRSLCSSNTDDTIYDAVECYVSHGVSETKWKDKKKELLLDAIKHSSQKLNFVKLLSMRMPRIFQGDIV